MLPSGVCKTIPMVSGIECVVLKNETVTSLKSISVAASTTWKSLNFLTFLSALSLTASLARAIVNSLPNTGTLKSARKYGRPPIASAWPWVKKTPTIRSALSFKNDQSGTTTSIPISSFSGYFKPQSKIKICSSTSTAYMFLPFSCTPPKGVILILLMFAPL